MDGVTKETLKFLENQTTLIKEKIRHNAENVHVDQWERIGITRGSTTNLVWQKGQEHTLEKE